MGRGGARYSFFSVFRLGYCDLTFFVLGETRRPAQGGNDYTHSSRGDGACPQARPRRPPSPQPPPPPPISRGRHWKAAPLQASRGGGGGSGQKRGRAGGDGRVGPRPLDSPRGSHRRQPHAVRRSPLLFFDCIAGARRAAQATGGERRGAGPLSLPHTPARTPHTLPTRTPGVLPHRSFPPHTTPNTPPPPGHARDKRRTFLTWRAGVVVRGRAAGRENGAASKNGDF